MAGPAPAARGPRAWWTSLPQRRRVQLRVLVAVATVLFLLVSVLLARWLQLPNVERDDDLALVQAEARGDVNGMLDQLSGCRRRPSCVAAVRREAADPAVHRSGAVKILALSSPTENALGAASGQARLAWTVLGTLPVVQCVTVRRRGNFFSGVSVALLALSAPIPNEGKCTKASTAEREEEEATEVEQ